MEECHVRCPAAALSKKVQPESSRMAECVADTQALLSCILSGGGGGSLRADSAQSLEDVSGDCSPSPLLAEGVAMQTTLLEECEAAFMACYHTFYPSTMLKWRGLCELLVEPVSLALIGVL